MIVHIMVLEKYVARYAALKLLQREAEMKRLYFLSVVLLAMVFCSSAFAAEYNHKKISPEKRMEHLSKMLDLTPDQQVKVKDIIVRRDAEMGPLFKSLAEANDKEEQREIKLEIIEQHQKFRKELDAVLTEPQRVKYREFIEQRIKEKKMGKKK